MKKSSVVVVCDVAAVVDARDQILERLERSFVVFLHVDREQILRHLRSVGVGYASCGAQEFKLKVRVPVKICSNNIL